MRERKYQCFICGELFENYQDFKSHIESSHDQGREWICCPVTFCQSPVRDLRAHFKAKHPSLQVPKSGQLRAAIWYDPKNFSKKKPTFKEGYFLSNKNCKSLHYRSGYELKVYESLELIPEIKNYFVEPFEIPYFFGGKQRNYIPDLVVEFINGTVEMWEIKPANQTSIPIIKAKKTAATVFCETRGITYKMITESFIDKLSQKAKQYKDITNS